MNKESALHDAIMDVISNYSRSFLLGEMPIRQ